MFLSEGFGGLGVFVGVDACDEEIGCGVFVGQFLEEGQGVCAGAAPAGPDFQQNHFAFQLGKEGVAVVEGRQLGGDGLAQGGALGTCAGGALAQQSHSGDE